MNNCEEQRILDMINKNKKCCRTCFGPTGPIGLSETIEVGETKNGDPGSKASVVDRGGPNHILDFTIPSGLSGLSKIQNASIKTTPNTFNPDTDFVSYGFRQTNTDNIYVGASKWIYNNEYSNVISQGIVAIDSTDNDYEIVNIGSKEIYLLSPYLNNIKSNSYFTNTLVNIEIEYLGK